MTARVDTSAMPLSKELGYQYRTAWHMLHRVREACKAEKSTLSNVYEVGEIKWGQQKVQQVRPKELGLGWIVVGTVPVVDVHERGGKVSTRLTEKGQRVRRAEVHREQYRTKKDHLQLSRRSLVA